MERYNLPINLHSHLHRLHIQLSMKRGWKVSLVVAPDLKLVSHCQWKEDGKFVFSSRYPRFTAKRELSMKRGWKEKRNTRQLSNIRRAPSPAVNEKRMESENNHHQPNIHKQTLSMKRGWKVSVADAPDYTLLSDVLSMKRGWKANWLRNHTARKAEALSMKRGWKAKTSLSPRQQTYVTSCQWKEDGKQGQPMTIR